METQSVTCAFVCCGSGGADSMTSPGAQVFNNGVQIAEWTVSGVCVPLLGYVPDENSPVELHLVSLREEMARALA